MTGPDPVHTLAADVERLARRSVAVEERIGELEGLLQQLATDVATLVSRSSPDGDGGVRAWLLTTDPKLAVPDLTDLAGWLAQVYLRYPDAALPACWCWHPALIEELRWLRCAHRQAYDEDHGTWQAVAEWHDRLRPGVARRIRDAYSGCELREHALGGSQHRPTPSVALTGDLGLIARAWCATPDTPLSPTEQQISEAEHHDQAQHQHLYRQAS